MRGWRKHILYLLIVFFSGCMNPLFAFGKSPESESEIQEANASSEKEVQDDTSLEDLIFLDEEAQAQADDELMVVALLELEDAFEAKDEALVSSILKKYSSKRIYPIVEDYSKKQINRFIIDNEIGFVLAALYDLIDTNIDAGYEDDEAIEMYYTIYESYALQKQSKSR